MFYPTHTKYAAGPIRSEIIGPTISTIQIILGSLLLTYLLTKPTAHRHNTMLYVTGLSIQPTYTQRVLRTLIFVVRKFCQCKIWFFQAEGELLICQQGSPKLGEYCLLRCQWNNPVCKSMDSATATPSFYDHDRAEAPNQGGEWQ